MLIKRLKNVGGFSSLTRYINFLGGLSSYVATTNSTAIIIPAYSSPYWQIQNWYNGTTIGFNGKYSDPVSNISWYLQGSSFSRAKGYVGAAYGSTPYLSIWPFNDAVGFGTKYGDPSTLPNGAVGDIQLDIDDGYVFVANAVSPYMTAYSFTPASGFGSKIADPASLLASRGYNIQYNNGIVFAGIQSGACIYAYTFTNGSFGTRYSDPTTTPAYGGYSLAIHPSGNAVGTSGISGVYLYAWNNTSGFGTKYAQPSSNPYAYTTKFSSTGNTVAIENNSSSPYVHAYPFTVAGGFGTKYSNPATAVPGVTPYYNNLAFSYGAAAIAVGTNASPYIHVYAFSEGTGFGSKYADPITVYANGSFTGGINFN